MLPNFGQAISTILSPASTGGIVRVAVIADSWGKFIPSKMVPQFQAYGLPTSGDGWAGVYPTYASGIYQGNQTNSITGTQQLSNTLSGITYVGTTATATLAGGITAASVGVMVGGVVSISGANGASAALMTVDSPSRP